MLVVGTSMRTGFLNCASPIPPPLPSSLIPDSDTAPYCRNLGFYFFRAKIFGTNNFRFVNKYNTAMLTLIGLSLSSSLIIVKSLLIHHSIFLAFSHPYTTYSLSNTPYPPHHTLTQFKKRSLILVFDNKDRLRLEFILPVSTCDRIIKHV